MQAAWFDAECRRCPRLASFLVEVGEKYPRYHSAPVPPFGDPHASLLIVGLAPGLHGANATGRAFTGDFAGILLFETLHRFGFATQPQSRARHDDLRLTGCRITNAVKCLPPRNAPTAAEVNHCNGFLRAELRSLPRGGVALALGTVAHRAVLKTLGLKLGAYGFAHGAEHWLPRSLTLLDSYHCSRYNTQTGRLTEAMFQAVFERAVALLGRPVHG
jgi:uracil-DNA glycosylase family 4